MVISCNHYDHIEIVCMHHYPIKLTLHSGTVLEGTALDTQRNENKDECIKIDNKGKQLLVVLDDISTLEVCVENPHFNQISFS